MQGSSNSREVGHIKSIFDDLFIVFESDFGRQYLVLGSEKKIEINDFQLEMIRNNRIPGLIIPQIR